VAVCGDAASDPIAAAVFFGLGVRSLSVRPSELANGQDPSDNLPGYPTSSYKRRIRLQRRSAEFPRRRVLLLVA